MTAFGSQTTLQGLSAAAFRTRFGQSQALIRRERDITVNPGTIGLWDFASQFGAPGAAPPDYTPVTPLIDGTQMKNLVFGGAPAVKDDSYGVLTYVNGGILIQGTGFGPSIKLADVVWKAGLMLTAWFKGSGVADVGFNARFMQVGPLYAVPTAAQGGGAAINFEIIGPGGLDIPVDAYSDFGVSIRAAMSDGQLHQVALHAKDQGSGNYSLAVYLDRVPVFESGNFAVGNAVAGFASIGARGGAGGVAGPWYRARLDDISQASVTADEIIARDYEANIDRLKALI